MMRRRQEEFRIKEPCKLCEHDVVLSYKNPDELRRYMNKLGKILPRRATRLCGKHHRSLAREIKRARQLALLPYVMEQQAEFAYRGGSR